MFYDEEEEVRVIESLDGSELWTEKSVGYVVGDTEGTVYLNHRDPDQQETAEAFSPVEAMGLAIELMRAAGVHEAVLGRLEDRLKWKQIGELIDEFSSDEICELEDVAEELFDVIDIFAETLSLDDVREVIRVYKEREELNDVG